MTIGVLFLVRPPPLRTRLANFSYTHENDSWGTVSGYTWYGDDSFHLAHSQDSEQARPVKTVKVQVPSTEGGPGLDRWLRPGKLVTFSGSRSLYRPGHWPVGSHMAVRHHCLVQEADALGSMCRPQQVFRKDELCFS